MGKRFAMASFLFAFLCFFLSSVDQAYSERGIALVSKLGKTEYCIHSQKNESGSQTLLTIKSFTNKQFFLDKFCLLVRIAK